VDAFTTATRQMLDSINQELSNGLATGQAQVIAPSTVPIQRGTTDSPELPATSLSAAADAGPHPVDTTEPTITSAEVAREGDQLLAQLKEQLAQQLNQ